MSEKRAVRYPVRVTSAWAQRIGDGYGDRWEAVVCAHHNLTVHFVLSDEAKAKAVVELLLQAAVTEASVSTVWPRKEDST